MKKIILLFGLLLIFSGAFSQNKQITTIVEQTELLADTINIGMGNYSGPWGLIVETFSLDAADAQIKIQVAYSTTSKWVDFASASTLDLPADSATGFEHGFLLYRYVRLVVIPNSVTLGDYKVTLFTLE